MDSHYVVPSEFWVSDPQAKSQLIEEYKSSINAKDCRHFDFGRGQCPFGSSCFYRHADEGGNVVEEKVRFRAGGRGGGLVLPMQGVRLSDFLTSVLDQDGQGQ